jgi:hypothetical protein
MAEQTAPAPAGSPTPVPAQKPKRRGIGSYLLGSLIGALVLLTLYTLFLLWWSYSEGERAGVLQKFSKRGWICKTHEGELAMYVVGGVGPQIWNFSVRDDGIARELQSAVGKQVRLHYSEHRGLPTNCFGETNYFVDGIEIVGPAPYLQPPDSSASPPETETGPQ